MAVIVTDPIEMDIVLYLDTDNVFDIPVEDEAGNQLDVEGWTSDLEIYDSPAWLTRKLHVDGEVVEDPEDAEKNVLRISVTDDLLQPGTGDSTWRLKKYPYSIKRTNPGAEKIVTRGWCEMRRAR